MSDKFLSTDEMQTALDRQAEQHSKIVADLKDTFSRQQSAAEEQIAELTQIANSVRLPSGKLDWQKLMADGGAKYRELRSTAAGRRLLGLKG